MSSILLFGSLAACSGDSSDEATPSPTASETAADEPSAEDIAALESVTVAGDAGAEPTLDFEQPFTVSVPTARVTAEGDGADLADGQVLTMNYLAVSGEDGSTQGTTYGAAADYITLGDASLIPALNTVLTGQQVGTRILLALPGSESAEGTSPTTLMAVEVTEAKDVPSRAEGEAVAPAAGLPTVELADDGAPTITPAEGEAPAELVVQPLITGTGAPVESGQTVTFQYTGVLWDGTPFDSSWTNGSPFTTTIGTGSVIKGWDDGLVGQPVGSQVLLVVPPALGYGESAQGSIPANSTLVFVVDILDAS